MSSQKQKKKPDLVKNLGLTPSQTEHLLMGYLCMPRPKIDWKKLGELSNVTPSSARTVFTNARRNLERWEEKRTAGAITKENEQAEDDHEHVEDAHEDIEN
ncbi:hypothetical protein N7491_002426 [Penicillium cf. griseofulvum]|uniref:Uncharacterized protein n=1 Tax=Penicillium cf. griseofulvum TaxID=2972120 RepID=A0A9W9T2E6_9EURO|nr:hypothetical protein N7472_003392 [Penicillium cf. griseofulvum]KAJ5446344.1 hypothetical protein N7491_002426 [Penicillium cf. griseofulvum]KAJ5448086.1 hypothetical protein N7445_002907 [Penicillium cf. griseofulvum]